MAGNNGYNLIAPYYDRLAALCFGNKLMVAQTSLLQYVAAGSHMLIVGGGTGLILEAITRICPTGLKITYADASEKMVALARQRDIGGNEVLFTAKPVQELPAGSFDMVVTPFLIDNFTEPVMQQVMAHLDGMLNTGGLWLFTDFCNPDRRSQQFLLRSMYLFFAVVCGIGARRLPLTALQFARLGYVVEEEKVFLNGFVKAVCYKKPYFT